MAFDLQHITLTEIIAAIFLAGFSYGKVRTMVRRNGNGHGTWGDVVGALQSVVDALSQVKAEDALILQEIRDHNESADDKWTEVNRTMGGQGRALEGIKTTVANIQSQLNTKL